MYTTPSLCYLLTSHFETPVEVIENQIICLVCSLNKIMEFSFFSFCIDGTQKSCMYQESKVRSNGTALPWSNVADLIQPSTSPNGNNIAFIFITGTQQLPLRARQYTELLQLLSHWSFHNNLLRKLLLPIYGRRNLELPQGHRLVCYKAGVWQLRSSYCKSCHSPTLLACLCISPLTQTQLHQWLAEDSLLLSI